MKLFQQSEFQQSEKYQEILNFHCPRYNEFPSIELYMDQVLMLINDSLSIFAFSEGEKIITATMVNNYVKQGVVSPSIKKKYDRNHLSYLFVVCILKQILSIAEICQLIKIQIATSSTEHSYDVFCDELEHALKATFTDRNFTLASPEVTDRLNNETELLHSAVISVANKIYIQKWLQVNKINNPLTTENSIIKHKK